MNDLLVVKDIIKYILDRISEKTPAADDKKLSHKAWRRHLKKMRRRESRQAYARDRRDSQRREQEEYYRVQSKVEAKRKEEEASREKHEEWVAREEVSQKEFQKKREDEAEKQRIKEEKEKKIREEWEAKEREEEKQRQIQQQKNEMLHNEMRGVDQQHRRHDDRYNPEAYNQKLAPTNWTGVSSDLFGTELDPRNCKFYIKTGACRFGNKCTRIHLKFENSPTIMIQNFFSDARLAIPVLNEHNNDSALEFDEVELIKDYERFYEDVIEEFRDAGGVVMFKCCQNFMPYLRGNVYVQYSTHEGAMRALQKFNGRWYAGRQLSVELSPVTNWKSSICGLFDKRLCPRGKTCNFLHVFRNPGNAYSVPNRTDFDPERACKTGYDPKFINTRHPVFAYYSQRDNIGGYGYRREDAIKHESVERSKKYWDNNTKNCDDDYRSKKRSKRSRSRSYSSRSRSRSRSRRKRSSHSRSRTRSRSKDKKRSRKDSRSSNSSRSSRRSKKEGSVSSTSTEWSDLSEDVPPEP